ncbi:unnamed protein product [Ilex paraguariensis]|uniref:AB hydrolase-1 domain-containing protein n=1 Tax=Ilex paraguariensis TaxID=185542 RepID=A0ABC8T1L4_9AQUA
MGKCFSFTATRNSCYKFSFTIAGLKSSSTDLGDGTVIHCWVPKTHKAHKPNLVLIHGIGANAMWQWNEFISPLISKFNVYVPDLVFFGESYTSRPERSESFQAQCVMRAMEAHGVNKMNLVGLSYGGFVGYSLAAQFPAAVERVVICCAAVCMEDKDMEEGMFIKKSVEEVMSVLFAQTPEKLREMITVSFYKPPKTLPSCFLSDFIEFELLTLLPEMENYGLKRVIKDVPGMHEAPAIAGRIDELETGILLRLLCSGPLIASWGKLWTKVCCDAPVLVAMKWGKKEMHTVYVQERKELVQALHKDRKLSDLPKITQILDAAHINHLGRTGSDIPTGIGTPIEKALG